MAQSKQYSRSVLGASDEVPDIYCEPCHQPGRVAIAVGYCVECSEYICEPCYKTHRRQLALVNHVLLDRKSMPLCTDSRRRDVDVYEEKCSIHHNEVIKLFCETCDKLVCHICVAVDHRHCEKVKYIPDIVKSPAHTEEFQKFSNDLKSMTNTLSQHQKNLQANVSSNNDMRTLARQVLKHQRTEVNRFFDQLEKKMDDHITTIEKQNQDTLKAASDRLDQVKTDLDQIKNDIVEKNAGKKCGLFIAMKQSQEKMKTFSDQFDKIQEELRIQHYALLPSEQIEAMMRTTTEICRIATARFESEIDIKTSTDRTVPCIASLSIVHGNYCVALDKRNNSIKVIDTNSKCVTSEITIEAENIRAVTSVRNHQVAVSVDLSWDTKQIQFFTVSSSGIIERTKTILRTNQRYDVQFSYYDIVNCSGNIYGHAGSYYIDKLSMTGKIIRTIYKDKGGVERIAASPDGQTLYVTNSAKHSITSMTLDGKVKAIFKDKDLKKPVGITVDKHGYVYVCSCDTETIQQLTADLNKVGVPIDVYGDAITYSSVENKLYISDGHQIRLYSLDFK